MTDDQTTEDLADAKVKYVGPRGPGVILPPPGNLKVGRGETVLVPGALAASLLEQPDNWVASRARAINEPGAEPAAENATGSASDSAQDGPPAPAGSDTPAG